MCPYVTKCTKVHKMKGYQRLESVSNPIYLIFLFFHKNNNKTNLLIIMKQTNRDIYWWLPEIA